MTDMPHMPGGSNSFQATDVWSGHRYTQGADDIDMDSQSDGEVPELSLYTSQNQIPGYVQGLGNGPVFLPPTFFTPESQHPYQAMDQASAEVYIPDGQYAPQVGTEPVYTEGSSAIVDGKRPQLDDATEAWAAQIPRPNDAKRMAIATPSREMYSAAADKMTRANQIAKAAVREKKEAQAKMQKLEAELERLQSLVGNVVAENIEKRDQQWNEHLKTLEKGTNDKLDAFMKEQHDHEERIKQVDAQLAAKDEERKQMLEQAEANHQREQEKIQADFDTKMATFHARHIHKNPGARGTESGDAPDVFPEGPPARPPQFISKTTREDRAIDTVIRNGYGQFPKISMSAPTPAEPSAAPGPSTAPETTTTPGQTLAAMFPLNDPVFIKELCKVLGLPLTARTGKKMRKSRKKPQGTMTVLTDARRLQQATLTPEQDLLWKALWREVLRMLTGCNTFKDFKGYRPITEAVSKRCDDGDEKPVAFRFYFGPGWAEALWNEMLFDKVLEEIELKRSEDPQRYGLPDVTEGYQKALYHNYLKEARSEWSRHQARPGESIQDANKRAELYTLERQNRIIMHSRKQHKYDGRMVAIERMIRVCLALVQKDAVAAWKWLRDEILTELGVEGMSSEEDEPAEVICGAERVIVTTHKMMVCAWRADEVEGYMKVIDKAADKTTQKLVQKRIRQRTGEISTAEAPIKLARYLYDASWLEEQKEGIPEIEEQLMIQEKSVVMMNISVYEPSLADD